MLQERYFSNERRQIITVRCPASLHKSLKDEAHNMGQRGASLNKLCVAKLQQPIAVKETKLFPTLPGREVKVMRDNGLKLGTILWDDVTGVFFWTANEGVQMNKRDLQFLVNHIQRLEQARAQPGEGRF